MKKIIIAVIGTVFLIACNSDDKSGKAVSADGVHTAVVEEVLQTSDYTYLRVKEDGSEPWLAVSKMAANKGETYYYKGGLPMHNFESKELNRTFEEVLFLDNISATPAIPDKVNTAEAAYPQQSEMSGSENAGPDQSVEHTVQSEEVLQTSKYTYIRVKENGKEQWLAVSKMEAAAGKTYYFKGGLVMNDFVSKELKRTFPEILFVDNIYTDKSVAEVNASAGKPQTDVVSKGSAIDLEKKAVKISHSKDEITIGKLIENKKSYAGKTIKIKGQVAKFTGGIMKKNWIHLQDGTEFSGKFDLTVTTDQEVNVGDNIVVEGVITLDKDFGYGYFYEVLMEDAKVVKL